MLRFFDDAGKQAGFDPVENVIWIRKKCTNFELLHESKHAEECFLIGKEEYLKGRLDIGGDPTLNLIRKYKREKYVFDELMKQEKHLSKSEVEFSKWYLNDIIAECIDAGININN